MRALTFTACLLATLAAATNARAQPSAAPSSVEDTQRKDAAKAQFDVARALVDRRAYDEALVAFRKSYATFPTRAAAQNVGIMLQELGRFDEALETFEAALRTFEQMKAEDRTAIEAAIVELRRVVAVVVIKVSEPNAFVTVDGVDRTLGEGSIIRVTAGSHRLRVFKEGFLPFEQRLEVSRGETTTVTAKLDALLIGGRLAVAEDQARIADVLVDGVPVGKTPWEGTLAVGTHVVTLRGEGNQGSAPLAATVERNHLTKLTALMEPLACRLRVVPAPANAIVSIDGVNVGAGAWAGSLRCGGHRLDASADGFVAATTLASLDESREGNVTLRLERDPGYGKIPTRVALSSTFGLLMVGGVGGDTGAACNGGCSSPLGAGGHFALTGGVRFGSGFGLGLHAGYTFLSKRYEGRDIEVEPVGYDASAGRSQESVRVSGPQVGAAVWFERGDTIVWSAKVATGALFTSWSATHSLALTTPSGAPYAVDGLSERGSLVVPYVAPELRVGYRILPHLHVDAGVAGLGLLGLDRGHWSGSAHFPAGLCPSQNVTACQGTATTKPETIFSSVFVSGGPFLGVSAEL